MFVSVDLGGCHSSMWQLRVTVMTKVSPLWFDFVCPAEVLQLKRADNPVQSHAASKLCGETGLTDPKLGADSSDLIRTHACECAA